MLHLDSFLLLYKPYYRYIIGSLALPLYSSDLFCSRWLLFIYLFICFKNRNTKKISRIISTVICFTALKQQNKINLIKKGLCIQLLHLFTLSNWLCFLVIFYYFIHIFHICTLRQRPDICLNYILLVFFFLQYFVLTRDDYFCDLMIRQFLPMDSLTQLWRSHFSISWSKR